jgi:hypothetical protein
MPVDSGDVVINGTHELKAEVQPVRQLDRVQLRDAGKRKPRVYDDEYEDLDSRRVKARPGHDENHASRLSTASGRGKQQVRNLTFHSSQKFVVPSVPIVPSPFFRSLATSHHENVNP